MKHTKDCKDCQEGKLGYASKHPEIMDYSAHSTEAATWGNPYASARNKNPFHSLAHVSDKALKAYCFKELSKIDGGLNGITL